ncbi:hypothetical protein CK215_25950 [Mesorhizobium sp. WSM3864]|uniref:hypothetical protein n=1 Tax=Mesorhizobium sp. WSM3864 TaxID=2029404 RepID=UPI000BAF1F8C|nr:hypothetical protein [Mesorhizobium sp. WSM3864]PBB89733.1 hypothetical protein CK215_25950 [Mesorhizobium sp. WSM3864]
MGDSDNSMTLARVTRSRLLPATPNSGEQPRAVDGNHSGTDQSADPAVAVWREWQAAHDETEQLCLQQHRLERKLVETVGVPCATILLRDGERMTAHSLEALHEVLDLSQENGAAHAKAEAEFAAHQMRWDTADREVGYTATLRAEREAAARAEALLYLLSETPANSLAGVAAKLDAVLREGQTSKEDAELPWPQIRSALEDIGRLG